MASALSFSAAVTGQAIVARPARRAARRAAVAARAGGFIKVNTVQEGWTKEFFGSGILVENNEQKDGNFLKKMEEKKLLSFVEKAGLLSQAEKAGITLKKVEELKLLSTAENLGLLSLAESAASTDGALISSLSLPFVAIAIAALVLIPDQNLFLTVVQDLLAASLLAGAGGLFIGGFLVNALNE